MQDRSALAEPVLSVAPRESQSSRGSDAQTLLLVESRSLVGGPSPLLAWLKPRERELVLSQGRRRVLNRGQTLFSQGAPHEGIYLVESGRIRVFYMAPSGREITLAYWNPGNFVGGPEIFGSGPHMWSGVGTRSITERLAHLLLHLVDIYGVEDRDGILIGATFTHADLAHMVGATRQWITISLKRLQDQGVVVCHKSRIVVRRLDALEEMRGQDG